MTHSSNSNDINKTKKTDQPTYTIRQISNLYKLPTSTLRYYEDLGLLTDVVHTASGARIYDLARDAFTGNLLCMISSFVFAVYLIVSKKLLEKVGVVTTI